MGIQLSHAFHSSTKKPIVTPHDRAILDLKIQRDKLQQYQKKIELILIKETDIARTFLANNQKNKALLALKKKRYQQQLLDKTDAQLITVEQMVSQMRHLTWIHFQCQSIEYALVERRVVEGLKHGNTILKLLNHEMNVDNLKMLMEDTADAIAYQNVNEAIWMFLTHLWYQEMETLLGSSLSADDESGVLKELDSLVEASKLELEVVGESINFILL